MIIKDLAELSNICKLHMYMCWAESSSTLVYLSFKGKKLVLVRRMMRQSEEGGNPKFLGEIILVH